MLPGPEPRPLRRRCRGQQPGHRPAGTFPAHTAPPSTSGRCKSLSPSPRRPPHSSTTSFLVGTQRDVHAHRDRAPDATITYTGTLPTGVTFVDNGDGTATLSEHPGHRSGSAVRPRRHGRQRSTPDAVQNFTLTSIRRSRSRRSPCRGRPSTRSTASNWTATGGSGKRLRVLGARSSRRPVDLRRRPDHRHADDDHGLALHGDRDRSGQRDETFSQTYSLAINGVLAILPAAVRQAAVDSLYSQQLTATGGVERRLRLLDARRPAGGAHAQRGPGS